MNKKQVKKIKKVKALGHVNAELQGSGTAGTGSKAYVSWLSGRKTACGSVKWIVPLDTALTFFYLIFI